MTLNNIKEYFNSDECLLEYYDPTSSVTSKEDAIIEIYQKLVDHARDKKCEFVRDDIGYIFFSKGLLISFCVKKECRDKSNLAYFGNLIKSKLGEHFNCFLFNKNQKSIRFLERIGMKSIKTDNLVTLLSI